MRLEAGGQHCGCKLASTSCLRAHEFQRQQLMKQPQPLIRTPAPPSSVLPSSPFRTLLVKEVPQALDQLPLLGLALGQQLGRKGHCTRGGAAERRAAC